MAEFGERRVPGHFSRLTGRADAVDQGQRLETLAIYGIHRRLGGLHAHGGINAGTIVTGSKKCQAAENASLD